MIVNHQHRLDPAQRPTEVYQRKEFVDALTFPVLTTGQLFGWWRAEDWSAVRAAVLGRPDSGQISEPYTARSTAKSPPGNAGSGSAQVVPAPHSGGSNAVLPVPGPTKG